mgnify:CR=1 FL=1
MLRACAIGAWMALACHSAHAELIFDTPEAKLMAQRVVQQIRSGAAFDVSAKRMSSDYRNNEIAADKKYNNKKLH